MPPMMPPPSDPNQSSKKKKKPSSTGKSPLGFRRPAGPPDPADPYNWKGIKAATRTQGNPGMPTGGASTADPLNWKGIRRVMDTQGDPGQLGNPDPHNWRGIAQAIKAARSRTLPEDTRTFDRTSLYPDRASFEDDPFYWRGIKRVMDTQGDPGQLGNPDPFNWQGIKQVLDTQDPNPFNRQSAFQDKASFDNQPDPYNWRGIRKNQLMQVINAPDDPSDPMKWQKIAALQELARMG